jgi:hypothetical protein
MDRKPNTNQHEAIAMILDPSPTPPILVIGPFGTGKTFTLSLACVSILSQPERKKVNKVLICTHSNSAATIHLQHLDEKIAKKPLLNLRPLRVYNLLRNVRTIPEKLRKYCLIEGIYRAIRLRTVQTSDCFLHKFYLFDYCVYLFFSNLCSIPGLSICLKYNIGSDACGKSAFNLTRPTVCTDEQKSDQFCFLSRNNERNKGTVME